MPQVQKASRVIVSVSASQHLLVSFHAFVKIRHPGSNQGSLSGEILTSLFPSFWRAGMERVWKKGNWIKQEGKNLNGIELYRQDYILYIESRQKTMTKQIVVQ